MKRIKQSIRAKFTLIFIGILCVACISSFVIMHGIWRLSMGNELFHVMVDMSSEQSHRGYAVVVTTLLLCVFIGSALMYVATKRISKPIKYLSRMTKEVSKGNFDQRIEYYNEDEIGVLAENFNLMIDELNNMEYLRKDFISNVSHEFKTPIAAILGFVTMMKEKNLTKEQQDAYLNIIMEETTRLSHLTSNMLRISKLDHQSILNNITEFSLDEQIRKTVLLLEEQWEKKDLEFDIQLDVVRFIGEEELLQQVWMNLLDNAIKFSNDGGKIGITLKEHSEYIEVNISDNGIGISEENQKRIFERFYQGETSHAEKGNGLGLAIVHRIVEIYKGQIDIESEIGAGTCFSIRIPKKPDLI